MKKQLHFKVENIKTKANNTTMCQPEGLPGSPSFQTWSEGSLDVSDSCPGIRSWQGHWNRYGKVKRALLSSLWVPGEGWRPEDKLGLKEEAKVGEQT